MEAEQADAQIIAEFNRLYYESRVWAREATAWLGVPVQKLPLDLWAVQQILWETRPELIVETGVAAGGSALFYASVLDLLGFGEVIGIDVDLSRVRPAVHAHPRIALIRGDAKARGIARRVRRAARGRRTMVVLDSDHARDHVAAELAAYAQLVTPGCYLIVEDTNLNGHPVRPDFGAGPMEALDEWLAGDPPFTVDDSRQRFLATFNPRGFLRRSEDGPPGRPSAAPPLDPWRDRYLALLQRTLTGELVPEPLAIAPRPRDPEAAAAYDLLRADGVELVRHDPGGEGAAGGRLWPKHGVTMVGRARLDNLRTCLATIVHEQVPGDVIETGVWRGGASIFMRATLDAFGAEDRVVWAADSYAGLPAPDAENFPADAGAAHHMQPDLAVGLEMVKANFARYGLLDDRVRFVVGWFRDTLPSLPVERLALMRLDGDMFESTIEALDALYAKLSPGGFVVVDDYNSHPRCRRAVEAFRERHGIDDTIHTIDWAGAYWRRSGA